MKNLFTVILRLLTCINNNCMKKEINLLIYSILPFSMLGAPVPKNSIKKPNFVFFITDDISPRDLGIYGNKKIKTPNLDKLASKAVVFDNAYLTASSCSPSRCSIITGRYPHNTGAPELHMQLPESQLSLAKIFKNFGYYTLISGKNHIAKPEQLGFDIYSDSRPSGAENWIKHLKERPKEKPFFFWFASHDAHHGFSFNELAPIYKTDEIEVPPMLYDGEGTRKELAAYYHEVSRTDYYVGKIMDELEKQGILENTYFIYCSDNGRPFPRCKTYLYDSGIKTPLLVMGPKIDSSRCKSIVSSIDFAPTFLDLARIDKPNSFQGISFKKLLKGENDGVREVAFAERNWHVYQCHERMVRFDDYLYIWNAWPEKYNVSGESSCYAFPAAKEYWEAAAKGLLTKSQLLMTRKNQPKELLFNVVKDPYQSNNIVDSVEYKPILRKMRKLLSQWKNETGDSVPVHPTPNRQPLHKRVGKTPKRGEFAGQKNNAISINNSGPYRLSH
jgi:arylsulfatase